MAQFIFKAIGTSWQIDIYQKLDTHQETNLLSQIQKRIDLFDAVYSRFRTDSLVTRISNESGDFTFPDDAQELFKVYQDLYSRTNGLFTPLIGQVLSDAGYDAQYSLKPREHISVPPPLEDVLTYHYPILSVQKPALLDFGAAGKGYLIDLVAKVLDEQRITAYCINAGGDILHKGPEPIRVGLEDPQDSKHIIGIHTLGNGSICGSAGNRRTWDRFNHIINPKTGTSPTHVIAVWVMADSALIADALTTCLFFIPADKLRKAYRFEYILVRDDRSVEMSKHFSGEIFRV